MAKIPLSSLKNNISTETNKKIIKCSLCDGVLYEPIFSKKDKLNFCKTCFYNHNNISTGDLSINIRKLYSPSSKEIKNNLNSYKYSCPNFDFEEKEYTYDELINHLIICENNKIMCPSCGGETFIKNITNNEKQKLINNLLRNKILERELEYQKLRIIQMENEKSEIVKKNQKKEEENKKKEIKEKKEKIIIRIKSNMSKRLVSKSTRPTSKQIHLLKKVELPPIRRKNKISTKKEEPKQKLNFNNNLKFKERPKEIIPDNSNNNTMFDKCPHFYGNYMPKFVCCGKFYGCYLCHNENENHAYQFSNKVACLFCKNVYAGKTCTKCKANQLFQRKIK